MIKRFLALFAATVLLSSQAPVYADVVMGNEFYYQNEDKTVEIGRRYQGERFVINSPMGYVIPKEEPGSEKGIPSGMGYRSGWGYEDIDEPGDVVFVFKNGEIFTIEAVYLYDGKYWGVMSPSHMYQPPGWVLMDDLLLIYDRPYFETENEDNFYTYTGSYNAVLSAKKLVEWQWPGSDSEKRIIEKYISSFADVLYAYMDNEGREWGKTSYSGGWICLSDPENAEIPAFYPAPKPTKWSVDGIYDWTADVAVFPPADYGKLSSANKPQRAFDNIEENEFFLQHRKEIQKLDRNRFYANGPDGYAVLKSEPGSDGEILMHWATGPVTYENGSKLLIDYVYNLNGEYWAFMDYAYDNPHPPGWIPMEHLLVMYTNDDFINEHRAELYPYTGDIRTAISTETFVLWEWPNSGSDSAIWGRYILDERDPITRDAYKEENGREWKFNSSDEEEWFDSYSDAIKWLYIEHAYEDEEGREWVYIETYWNGPVTGWLCVNDPENAEIHTFDPEPKEIMRAPDGIYDRSADADVAPDTGVLGSQLLIISLEALFVAVAAVLIPVFRKKFRKG